MTRRRRGNLLFWATVLAVPALAHAQGRGGGSGAGGGGSMGGGMQHGGFPPMGGGGGAMGPRSSDNAHIPGRPPLPGSGPAGTNSTMRGGLQLGPPGRFWDDKNFAKTLGLRKDQQKRMDAIFDANRASLVESYKSLQGEEKRLEKITKERPLVESHIFAGIDAVVQARGELEKANAHMLLLIRREMDPDQVAKMDNIRDEPLSEDR